jgi:predicted tellurium resistance membrane protein TerC
MAFHPVAKGISGHYGPVVPENSAMAKTKLFHPYLLKIALLFSLLLILFLLTSFRFLSPDQPIVSNTIQSVNFAISSPYLIAEDTVGISFSWSLTGLFIFCFWFIVTYAVLMIFHNTFWQKQSTSDQSTNEKDSG